MSSSIQPSYRPIIDYLRRRLHAAQGSKAAVMIGAGFSKNAISLGGSTRTLPLWSELTTAMTLELCTDGNQQTEGGLRQAEEYEWTFGRSALIDFVRKSVDDNDFIPSPLHEQLVDLPWADIFTTNYDRLIERAAQSRTTNRLHKRAYEVVSHPSDVPTAHRPRIVKLHGTLPDLDNLVITEEDFRRYPHKNAVFVNLVKASLSENTFCLLGFSGDDPNFLAWTGWVRDMLTKHSPKIILFSTEPVSRAKRGLLESRGIIPVPILEAFDCKSARDGLAELFDYLSADPENQFAKWNRRPKWVDRKERDDEEEYQSTLFSRNKTDWVKLASIWRWNRIAYRGWIVLDAKQANLLWHRTNDYHRRFLHSDSLKNLTLLQRLVIARELLWRLEKAYVPIADNLALQLLDPLVVACEKALAPDSEMEANTWFDVDGERLSFSRDECSECLEYIKLQLLRHARELGDCTRFSDKLRELKNASPSNPTRDAFVRYQEVLWHIGRLRIFQALELLNFWDTSKLEDVWTVRKIGLLMELGQTEGCESLLNLLTERLAKRNPHGKDYIPAKSIEGLFLTQVRYMNWYLENKKLGIGKGRVQATGNNPNDSIYIVEREDVLDRLEVLGDFGCNPIQTQSALGNRLAFIPSNIAPANIVAVQEEDGEVGDVGIGLLKQEIENAYYDSWQFIRFLEEAGIARKIMSNISSYLIAETAFSKAVNGIAGRSQAEAIALLCRTLDPKALKQVLTPDRLCKLPVELVERLFDDAMHCLDELLTAEIGNGNGNEQKIQFVLELIRKILPVITDENLAELARKLIVFDKASQFQFLNSATKLEQLLKTTLAIVSKGDLSAIQQEVNRDELNKERVENIDGQQFPCWVAALCAAPRCDEVKLGEKNAHYLSELIRFAKKETDGIRERAMQVLSEIFANDWLTAVLTNEFTEALFSQLRDDGFPADTGCYDSLILQLPIEESKKERLFRAYLEQDDTSNSRYWYELERTVTNNTQPDSESQCIAWSVEEIKTLLAKSSAWMERIAKRRCERSVPRNSMQQYFEAQDEEFDLHSQWGWKTFLVEAALMSSQFDQLEDLLKKLVQEADSCGIDFTRALPCLAYRGRVGREEAERKVLNTLKGGGTLFQDGCDAVRRFAWLETIGQMEESSTFWERFFALVEVAPRKRIESLFMVCHDVLLRKKSDRLNGLASSLIDQIKQLITPPDAATAIVTNESIRARVSAIRLAKLLESTGISFGAFKEQLLNLHKDRFVLVRRAAERNE